MKKVYLIMFAENFGESAKMMCGYSSKSVANKECEKLNSVCDNNFYFVSELTLNVEHF